MEIKTTIEIFHEECGSAYTDIIHEPYTKWVKVDSLLEAIERHTKTGAPMIDKIGFMKELQKGAEK